MSGKAVTVADAEKALEAAKKAHKGNKDDKSLKAAYKGAKAALEAAQEAAKKAAEEAAAKKRKAPSSSSGSDSDSDSDEAPAKKQKVPTLAELQAAAEAAKKAYKANKEDKSLKAAYKVAKQAVDDFKPAGGAAATKPAPAAASTAAPADDVLGSLKKKGNAVAPPAGNADENEASEKIFIGNLSWDIDDDGIKAFFADCGGNITDVFWLTDKESGRFKGCGFITFDNLESAKKAYAKKGQDLMGRDISIDYAKARAGGGDKPKKAKSPFENKGLSERPEGCTTTFCGNLSFDIDEDGMRAFAEDCGEIKVIRWLSDRESGDFKGCGFVEFYEPEAVDKFVLKNGQDLMGRAIRIDYSVSKAK